MCQTTIPSAESELIKSCASCGADPTRWIKKKAVTPPILASAQTANEESVDSRAGYGIGRGILGAVIGAVLGVGIMYGFYELVGFRFPMLGMGIGALTGLGARLLNKGSDDTLGQISGGVALVAVVGTLYLMYGEFPILSIISVVVSVSLAYRIASQ